MPHTLLLADDSVTIQRVIELTFADEDVRVVAVSDGDQAIAVIDRTPPDIVLADVGMPGRSGYEVAQYIKQTPHLAHIPVVLLTGAFEPIDQARADAVGCDGVLAKPFEPQLVIGRVKELLGRAKQTTASPDAQREPPAQSWTPPFPAPEPAQAPVERSTEDYFEHLDQAFATRSGSGQAESPSSGAAAPPVANTIDWFGLRPASSEAPVASDTWDIPAQPSASERSLGRPTFGAAPPPSDPFTWTSPPPPPMPPSTTAPVVLPPLADAFAALLAAEQGAPSPVSAPAWPGSSPPTAVTDDLVEQVTRRVLDRLSDRIVRETVVEIVTDVAERLVREEIERIKTAIK